MFIFRSNKRLRESRIINMLSMEKEDILELNREKFNISRASSTSAISWVLENVAINMFTILMGNPQKFSHSIFALQRDISKSAKIFGPLVYVDNDRSSWDNDIFKRGMLNADHPLGIFCKFPMETAVRILSVNESSSFTVGKLILDSVSHYSSTFKEKPLFTVDNAKWLDQRVFFLRDTIKKCIHNHGAENVLFPEPWYREYSSATWLDSLPDDFLSSIYSGYINLDLLDELDLTPANNYFQNFDNVRYQSRGNLTLRKFV